MTTSAAPSRSDKTDGLLDAAVTAATRAGAILAERQADARSTIKEKASAVDVVTDIDTSAENAIVELISSQYPDDGIVGEEGASRPSRSGRVWIIDPLDGTANFIRQWKLSAVSIGIEIDGAFTIGVVYNPLADELFTARVGRGAYLNGELLRIGGTQVAFESAYIGLDGGYMTWAREQRALTAARIVTEAGELRQCGSTALDLCHVAMGRIDGLVNVGSSLWDIAAGIVIAREAGYIVEGLEAGSQPTKYHTIAGRPELIAPLRDVVAEAARKYAIGTDPSGN